MIADNYYNATGQRDGLFELKVCDGNTFNTSKLEHHQHTALRLGETSGIGYKIRDTDMSRKPADYVFFSKTPNSWVVVLFNRKKPKQRIVRMFPYSYLIDKDSVKSSEGIRIME